jgi:hypothetical protein
MILLFVFRVTLYLSACRLPSRSAFATLLHCSSHKSAVFLSHFALSLWFMAADLAAACRSTALSCRYQPTCSAPQTIHPVLSKWFLCFSLMCGRTGEILNGRSPITAAGVCDNTV